MTGSEPFERSERASDGAAGGLVGERGPNGAALAPIAGVDLDAYSRVVRAVAAHGYDDAALPGIAAEAGIAPDDWQRAHAGWNERIRADPEVARLFRARYRSLD